MQHTVRFVFASLCALVMVSTARTQQAAIALERESNFLRKIVRELGFLSLAQDEVDRLRTRTTDPAQSRSLLKLDIEIKLIAARKLSDRGERRALYERTLALSDTFIAKYRDDPIALKVRLVKVDAAYEFGQFLADELEVVQADDPVRVKLLEEDAAGVYRAGVATCDEVMSRPFESSGIERAEYLKCWLYKGILLREHGHAVKRDRAHLCQLAYSTLEDMIFTVGEESVIGQRGLFEIAKIQQVLGSDEEAARSFQDSVDASYKALMDPNNELGGAAFEVVVQTMEEAYEKLTSTLLELGKPELVLEVAEDYRTKIQEIRGEEGQEDPRFGHLVYLTEAQALAEIGGVANVAKALGIARKCNKVHPNDIVGLRAKSLLKDILTSQPAAAKATDLMEIAKGEHQSQNFDDAIRGYKRALAAATAEEGALLGLDAWHRMGLAFASQERYLEALLAMKRGIEMFPPGTNEEGDGTEVANHMKMALGKLQELTNHDEAFAGLRRDVLEVVRRSGGKGSEARLYWESGQQRFEEGSYLEAADAFGRISVDSGYFELSRARQATSLQLAGQPKKAHAVINAFREWQRSKEAILDANSPSARIKLANRQLANAECDFTEGFLLFTDALGPKTARGVKPDPAKLALVLDKLAGFKERYGQTAPILTRRALDTVARAQCELDRLDDAMVTYRSLRDIDDKKSMAPRLLSRIFQVYSGRVKARLNDYERIHARGDGSPEEIAAARDQLDSAYRAALACGTEYARTAQPPTYGTLYTALTYACQIAPDGDDTALALGNQIIHLYGSDPRNKKSVDQWVRLMLGEVLLRKRMFRESYEMLVEAEKSNPQNGLLKRNICRALGGWYEIDRLGRIIAVPGLDRQADAYQKYWDEYRRWGLSRESAPDYSLPWYQFYWEAYSYASRATEKDKKHMRTALTLYNIARSNDDFARLRSSLGTEGQSLYELFAAFPPR